MVSCSCIVFATARGLFFFSVFRAPVFTFFFFFQAEDGIRDVAVTGVQTCALPICRPEPRAADGRHGALRLAARGLRLRQADEHHRGRATDDGATRAGGGAPGAPGGPRRARPCRRTTPCWFGISTRPGGGAGGGGPTASPAPPPPRPKPAHRPRARGGG